MTLAVKRRGARDLKITTQVSGHQRPGILIQLHQYSGLSGVDALMGIDFVFSNCD